MDKTKTAKYLGLAAVVIGGGYLVYGLFVKRGIDLGDIPAFRFKWINRGPEAFAPDFRFDIRRRKEVVPWIPIYTWQEGIWIETPAVAPEETSEEVAIETIPIPGDWGEGTGVDVKLVARVIGALNETTVWQQDEAFVTKG